MRAYVDSGENSGLSLAELTARVDRIGATNDFPLHGVVPHHLHVLSSSTNGPGAVWSAKAQSVLRAEEGKLDLKCT